jgi:hypothetical protein
MQHTSWTIRSASLIGACVALVWFWPVPMSAAGLGAMLAGVMFAMLVAAGIAHCGGLK